MTMPTICDGEYSITTTHKGEGLAFYAPIAAKYNNQLPPPATLYLYACMLRSNDPTFVNDMLSWLHAQKAERTN